MATPNGDFFIQSKLKDVAPHHESFKQLWETKWRQPCERGLYPFMFGSIKDFQPIVNKLVEGDFKEPYDWDSYAQVYFPKAEELVSAAEQAEKENNLEKAAELYLRGSAVYRISRFPAPRSEKQRYAWQEGKKACIKGLTLRDNGNTKEVMIPHKYGIEGEGKHVPVYYHLPPGASKEKPVPMVIVFTGLDGYRTELAVWIKAWALHDVATVVVEIPGTGDSPALASDPTSPDRQWSSLLDWADEQEAIDHSKVAVWAFSTGGYYAIRLAHTHPTRLAGVVALGGGCHYMFDPRWLDAVNHLEYPFDLAHTLAYKWGYGNDLEAFKKEGMKFSLLQDGTLDKQQCARLLLVNGTEDEIFPIDDYELCLRHGAVKEARFVEDRKHMGEPESFAIIINWIYQLFGIEASPADALRTIPFMAKY